MEGVGFMFGVGPVKKGKAVVRMSDRSREKWPVGRFVRDALFFSPLGEILSPRKAENLAASSQLEQNAVVVTGATGGVGKRVVKELLSRGYKVRVVARTEERAKKALGDDFKRVEVVLSDLANLRKEFYQGASAVINCTGLKVGPTDDTVDREKYYQGVTFYPPVVLEDNAENVEYKGIENMVEKAKTIPSGGALIDFRNEEAAKSMWGVIDDVVMGGVSESSLKIIDQKGVFTGLISTANRGGFSSVRSRNTEEPMAVSKDATGLVLRVKGDGNRFKIIARTSGKWDGVGFSYSFDTVKDEWIDVYAPFDQFRGVFRAKTTDDKFDATQICSVQFMLSKFEYDGKLNPSFTPGVFKLEIDNVSTYSTKPKLVHISSAGVTRVLRTDEFPDLESQPPAVRMNAQLGRIMEWKLAGEDLIRSSGIPYFIIRPCALTEEEPKSSLEFAQGDNITGKVSRNDVAKLAVDAIQYGAKANITAEISDSGAVTDFGSALADLKTDNEESTRKYAPFPFVPQ